MRAVEIIYVLAEAKEPVTILDISKMSGDTEKTVKKALDEWGKWLFKTADIPPKFIPSRKLRLQLGCEDFIRSAHINLQSIRKQIADNLWEDTFT